VARRADRPEHRPPQGPPARVREGVELMRAWRSQAGLKYRGQSMSAIYK
jgi:hypothetical protein